MSGVKKYVSKQDVEKGLVDPTKPLVEQKDYLQKIEKEDREKQHPKDNKPQYRNKRQRQNKPEYNWKRRDVTQETPIPEAPKKQIPKPDKEKFYEKLNAMKKQIEDLNKKKSDLIQEMRATMRNTSDSKKTTRNAKTKYSAILGEKHKIKKGLYEELKLIDEKRAEAQKQMHQYDQKIGAFKKPDNFEFCSTEQLQARLEKTERKLTTQSLTKQQQNQINMRILEIKRALHKSRANVDIEFEISKILDQKSILYHQQKEMNNIKKQKGDQLRKIKEEIAKLNEELDQEKVQPEDTRSPEQIKADYDKKIEQVNTQKQKIKADIDKLKQAFTKSEDDYQDYFDLISYIKMVKEEKQKIKAWKEEQEKIKKQREEEEKKRKQQFEERQKKREEKAQRQEQRKKQNQQRKEKLQKQRQQYINRNPNQQKIDTCKSLIDYCESLKPENAIKQLQKREQKVIQPILELKPADSKDWEKELKKGAQVIVSKKFRDNQQVPKKQVKEKKKKEKQAEPTPTTTAFFHHVDTAKRFQKINLLPPGTVDEIESTIKQINERIELFSKPTEQEIKAYKERAEKQFDNLHGFDNERREGKGRRFKQRDGDDHHHEHKQAEHEHKEHKEHKQTHRPKKAEKTEITEKDFPGLN